MSETEEKKRGLTRRQAIAGGAGLGAILIGGKGISVLTEGDEPDMLDPDAALAAGCVLTPSMTEGPYFVDELLDRSDIRGGRPGVPLNLTVNVFSADASCSPYKGAVVDIWQCDAQGSYSDVSAAGNGDTSGQNWLRGLQVTDAEGKVEFTTIYPGWYQGRTIHIHLKVRTFDGQSTTYNFNTQLFFPEDTTAEVLSQPDYTRTQSRGTTNSNDGIFDELMVLPLEGSVSSGFRSTVDIGLNDLPEANTVPDTETDPEESDDSVEVKIIQASAATRKNGRRVVTVVVKNGEKARLDLRLLRGKKLLARRRTAMLKAGRHRFQLPVVANVGGGKVKVKVIAVDQAKNRRTLRRMLRLPRSR